MIIPQYATEHKGNLTNLTAICQMATRQQPFRPLPCLISARYFFTAPLTAPAGAGASAVLPFSPRCGG